MNYWIFVYTEEHDDFYKQNGNWWWWKNTEKYNYETARNHKEIVSKMEIGDKVLCYKGGVGFTRSFQIGDISSYQIELVNYKKIYISLEKIKKIYANEESRKNFLKLNAPKYSPFTQTGENLFYGSFFASTKEQFEAIKKL